MLAQRRSSTGSDRTTCARCPACVPPPLCLEAQGSAGFVPRILLGHPCWQRVELLLPAVGMFSVLYFGTLLRPCPGPLAAQLPACPNFIACLCPLASNKTRLGQHEHTEVSLQDSCLETSSVLLRREILKLC